MSEPLRPFSRVTVGENPQERLNVQAPASVEDTFLTENQIAEYLVDTVRSHESLFPGNVPESDVNIDVNGMDMLDLRRILFTLGAPPDDGAAIQAAFLETTGRNLVSPAGGNGVIEYSTVPAQELDSSRLTATNRGNRRNGLGFASANSGQTLVLNEHVTVDKFTQDDLRRIRRDPRSAIFIGGPVLNHIEGLVHFMTKLSCVALSFALRFQRSEFMTRVRSIMGYDEDPKSLPAKIQTWQQPGNYNKFLWELAGVVCAQRGIPHDISALYEPIMDVELNAICNRFEIGGVVLRPGAFEDFLQVTDSKHGRALVRKTEYDEWHKEVNTVTTVMTFSLQRLDRSNRRSDRSTMGFVFKASHMGESSAHVDVCLNYEVEERLLNLSATNFVATAVFDEDSTDHYGKQIEARLVSRKVEPDRAYGMIDPVDIKKFVRKQRKSGAFFRTSYKCLVQDGQYELFCESVIKAVQMRVDLLKKLKRDRKKWEQKHTDRVLGFVPTYTLIDYDLSKNFGSKERNMSGLVYLYGHLYNRIKEAGLITNVNLSRFQSALGAQRSRRMFTRFLKESPMVNEGRFDMCCKFDDLASFDVWVGDLMLTRVLCMDKVDMEFVLNVVKRHKWYKRALAMAVKQILPKDDTVAERRKLREKGFDPVKFAMRLASGNFYVDLLLRDFRFTRVATNVFGTFGPLREEMLDVYDPNHDEPVVSILRDGDVPTQYISMDCNSYYYKILMGDWDRVIPNDLHGFPWIHGALRRPSYAILTFEGNDFLSSYLADFGMVWIAGIDFERLQQMQPHTNRAFSWWRFATSNPERVQRYVHNGWIIHLCERMCRRASGRDWWREAGFDTRPTMRETWIYIQRDILHIKRGYFNFSPSERFPLKACLSNRINGSYILDSHLSGLWTGIYKSYRRGSKLPRGYSLQDLWAFRKAVEEATDGVLACCMDRRMAKIKINAAFGRFKHRYVGGLRRNSIVDHSRMKKSGDDGWDYKFIDTPMMATQMMQLHTLEVPHTDMILTEMVAVRPTTVAGSPRALRWDLLTRAGIVMDELQYETRAFETKTDCVKFHPDRLPGLLSWLQYMKIPGMKKLDSREYTTFSSDQMPPIKYEVINRLGAEGVDLEKATLDQYRQRVSNEQAPRTAEMDIAISKDGKQTRLDAYLSAQVEPHVTKTSDIFLSEVLKTGAELDADQVIPYHIEQAKRNRRTPLGIYRAYGDMLHETLIGAGSCVVEGPPGTGKSTALIRYIEDMAKWHNIVINVVTANHSTIVPYLGVHDGEKVFVSTFHSYVGTFSKMSDISNNPAQWFKSSECAARSMYWRATRGKGKALKVLIVDEYETLPVYSEEILYYLHVHKKVRIILVGDRYQTAPIGRGIRPDGSVVQYITDGRRIEFDLPFRTLDVEFYNTQRKACFEDPTLYLSPVLCNYIHDRLETPVQYEHLCQRIAAEYVKCGQERRSLGIITSSPDYKRCTVTVVKILRHMSDLIRLRDYEYVVHSGFNTFSNLKSDDSALGESFAEEDAELDQTEEQAENSRAEYVRRCDHFNDSLSNGPAGKNFMVGTRIYLIKDFEYVTIGSFKTQYRFTTPSRPDGGYRIQIRCGERMFYRGAKTMTYARGGKSNGGIPVRMYEFVRTRNGKPTRPVWLSEFEVRAKVFWPFGLYQGAVVGHTYDEYVMLNSYRIETGRFDTGHYARLDRRLQEATKLGKYAWTSSLVKQLNVAVTRVREGKKVQIMDVPIYDKTYWQKELAENSLIGSVHEYIKGKIDLHAYRQVLAELRASAVLSKAALYIYDGKPPPTESPTVESIERAFESIGRNVRRRVDPTVSE